MRQYFREGSDLSRHTAEDVRAVEDKLNNRPCKTSAGARPPRSSPHPAIIKRSALRRPLESAFRPLGFGRYGALAVVALTAAHREDHRIPHTVPCRRLPVLVGGLTMSLLSRPQGRASTRLRPDRSSSGLTAPPGQGGRSGALIGDGRIGTATNHPKRSVHGSGGTAVVGWNTFFSIAAKMPFRVQNRRDSRRRRISIAAGLCAVSRFIDEHYSVSVHPDSVSVHPVVAVVHVSGAPRVADQSADGHPTGFADGPIGVNEHPGEQSGRGDRSDERVALLICCAPRVYRPIRGLRSTSASMTSETRTVTMRPAIAFGSPAKAMVPEWRPESTG